jgi:EpsI family protein
MAIQRPLALLKSPPVVVLTLALIAQTVALRAVSRPESVVPAPPLATFPVQVGSWTLAQEGYVDEDTRAVLQADDLLSRTYGRPGNQLATNLFVASFLSQRNGKTPHSPKNCLPGAGWVQQTSEILPVAIPGAGPIEVNHYVIANRDARSDVMYWYQSRDRVMASEYRAHLWTMADAIRYNRTDTALIRVITPILAGQEETARKTNIEFIQAVFPVLRGYLPD